MRSCVLICGMHRTGTSLLSSIINQLGYFGGSDMISPTEDNPKGYFENNYIVNLNERILGSLNYVWDTPFISDMELSRLVNYKFQNEAMDLVSDLFVDSDNIFIKDPRVCLLLNFWQRILKKQNSNVSIICTLRNPNDTAISEFRRAKSGRKYHHFGFKENYTKRVWFTYIYHLLDSITANSLFIDYDDIIDKTDECVQMLCSYLDINKDKIGDVYSLIDTDLRRNKSGKLYLDNFEDRLFDSLKKNLDEANILTFELKDRLLSEYRWYEKVKMYNEPFKEFPKIVKSNL